MPQDIFELHVPLKHKAKDVRYNKYNFLTVEEALDRLLSSFSYIESFSLSDTVTIAHTLDTTDVVAQVYNSSGEMIIPESTTIIDSNNIRVTFAYALSGKVILLTSLDSLKSVINFSSGSVINAYHGLSSYDTVVQVYNSNNELIIPEGVKAINADTVRVTLASSSSGKIVVLLTSINRLKSVINFSSETVVDAYHGLSSTTLIIQVYNSNDEMLIPESIKFINSDTVRVTLASSSSGKIIVLGY